MKELHLGNSRWKPPNNLSSVDEYILLESSNMLQAKIIPRLCDYKITSINQLKTSTYVAITAKETTQATTEVDSTTGHILSSGYIATSTEMLYSNKGNGQC